MATYVQQGSSHRQAVDVKAGKRGARDLRAAIDLDDRDEDFRPRRLDDDTLEDPEQLELFAGERLPETWKPREGLFPLEFPIYSLQKRKDTRVRVYRNGSQLVRIIPSALGAANIFDQDLLVYVATLICKAVDAGVPVSRRIRFRVRDFLQYAKRSTGGRSYSAILDSCRRLKGTIVETNVVFLMPSVAGNPVTDLDSQTSVSTAEIVETLRGHSLIDNYTVITYTARGDGALELELILNPTTFNELTSQRVLAINPGYFRLEQGIDRRLYNLAKKHTGDKLWWKIGLDKLHAKSGSAQALKYFRRDIVDAIKADRLPEFHIALDVEKAMVVFFRCDRDNAREDSRLKANVHRELMQRKLLNWYYSLQRWDSHRTPASQRELLSA